MTPASMHQPEAGSDPAPARKGRTLRKVAREQAWCLPPMALLALGAAACEGLGLTLVIPLIEALDGGGNPVPQQGYLGKVYELAALVPTEDPRLSVLALMFAAVVLKSLLTYGNMALVVYVYGRVSHRLRTLIFGRIVDTPLAQLESQRSGNLLNLLNQESWRAADALNQVFVIVTSLFTALVLVTLLALLDLRLTLVALLSLSAIVPLVHVISRTAKRLGTEALATNEAMAQQTWSTLNGLRTIHSFGQEEQEKGRFGAISARVRGLFMRSSLIGMTSGPMTEIMATAAIAVLILLVDRGAGSGAVLIGFVALLYRLQPRLNALAAARNHLANLNASIRAVSALLDTAPAVEQRAMATPPDGTIAFSKVTFRYPDAASPAIDDLSLRLPEKGIVAVVGASGAGKSTLVDLLLGFQYPQVGEVTIGGAPLVPEVAAQWRRRIGVVSQDPYVFDDSVRANILYGAPEASDAEVEEAARAAAADAFIAALPEGYDTRVGERAAQISGGQRQRIALARALLRRPQVLVLDEATNALDADTEAAVHASLRHFASQGLVLTIAHRPGTVEMADHVVVLQDGRVAEQGSPAVLARAGGLFARMFATTIGAGPAPRRARGGAAAPKVVNR